jgi:hypothetical protein
VPARFTLRSSVLIAVIGLAVALAPMAAALALGFGGFVAAPILALVGSIGAGLLLARIAPSGLWSAVTLAACIAAATYTAALWAPFVLQATSPPDALLHGLPMAGAVFSATAVLSGALMALGGYIATRRS